MSIKTKYFNYILYFFEIVLDMKIDSFCIREIQYQIFHFSGSILSKQLTKFHNK